MIVNAINGSVFLLLYSLNLRGDMTESTGGAFRFLVGGIQTSLTTAQVAAAGAEHRGRLARAAVGQRAS